MVSKVLSSAIRSLSDVVYTEVFIYRHANYFQLLLLMSPHNSFDSCSDVLRHAYLLDEVKILLVRPICL